MRHIKHLFVFIAISSFSLFSIYILGMQFKPKEVPKINGFYMTQPIKLAGFKLNDYQGKTFTNSNLKAHWTLLFFGFTNCAMVCPFTMTALKEMYQQLENELPEHSRPQIIFVTIDPARDTKERLKSYLNVFNPKFIGLRGDSKDTALLMKQLHILVIKMQADGGDERYTLNHTTDIFVINPHGQLQASLAYPHQSQTLVKDYKSIIKTFV